MLGVSFPHSGWMRDDRGVALASQMVSQHVQEEIRTFVNLLAPNSDYSIRLSML
jgi:hypothetical protein